MPPRFLYFDLGNVLLNFEHRQACRQVGELAGVPVDRVWELVFASGLELRYEAGEIGDREFYEIFCRQTGTRPDYEKLLNAASDIFQVNISIVPLVAQLVAAQHRLGILSNTNSAHWAHCSCGRYGFLSHSFSVLALSYEIGCCKPDLAIYQAAAKLAGVAPEEIFYVDDVLANVEGACRAGFDAVQYTTTPALAAELRKRGLRCNY